MTERFTVQGVPREAHSKHKQDTPALRILCVWQLSVKTHHHAATYMQTTSILGLTYTVCKLFFSFVSYSGNYTSCAVDIQPEVRVRPNAHWYISPYNLIAGIFQGLGETATVYNLPLY